MPTPSVEAADKLTDLSGFVERKSGAAAPRLAQKLNDLLDQLLRSVARNWSGALRATDMLARFGGDEFSITLPDCSPELALVVVGRVQAATPPRIVSSAGIASSNGAETAPELLARADAALYDAKRHSRAVTVALATP